MVTLNLEEYQFTDTGMLLNGSSNGLPFVDVTSVDGLSSAPLRSQTHDREGVDGGYVDAQFETMRTITIEGSVYTDPNNTQYYLDNLKANFAPSTTALPFYFQTDIGQRFVYAKSLGFNYVKDAGRRLGITAFQIQLICEDPRIYTPGLVQNTASLIAVPTSGRSYNKVYPIVYGAAASNDSITVTLSGNRTSPGWIRINGPVVGPKVIYDTLGTTMDFPTLVLVAGDQILIDLAAKSVLLNNAINKRSVMNLTGKWFYLQPGDNNFRFSGTQTPATPIATLNVSARSAWR